MESGDLEVHGEWPHRRGQTCDACIAEEYWHEGTLDVPANVVWLRTGVTWHRLAIDCGVVFWRTADAGPKAYEMPELCGEVRLRDIGRELGLTGETIDEIAGAPAVGGADVWIGFRSGLRVTFRDRDDHTTYFTG
jgi:hypothetical protein